jgi:peptide deformylase
MEIIPIHYTQSAPVTEENLKQAMKEARAIATLVDRNKFARNRQCISIHHSQVSEKPFNFFVLDKRWQKHFGLPSRFIINPTFLPANVKNPVTKNLEPVGTIRIEEACMSFPNRSEKKVDRYPAIYAGWEVPRIIAGIVLGTKTYERELGGKAAQMFQHECDHAAGKNIYYTSPKH